MRPVPIEDHHIGAGLERVVIAGPDGDLTSTEIAPVEVVYDPAAGIRMIKIALEPGDLEALTADGYFWLTIMSNRLPPFSVHTGPELEDRP